MEWRNIYLWHLNKILDYRDSITTEKYPIIRTLTLNYETIPENYMQRSGVINSQKMLTDIVNNDTRNRLICEKVIEIYNDSESPKRHILLISSRREHIKKLKSMLNSMTKTANCNLTSGMYMGGMKNKELSISAEKDVIIGSVSVVKEGFDVPNLNTLMISTPMSEVTQLVGRNI